MTVPTDTIPQKKDESASSEESVMKYATAFIIALVGILVTAGLIVFLACWGWKAAEVSAVGGTFTTLVGTLVGAFLGVQVAGAGRQKAEDVAQKALGRLTPEKAKEITG